MDFAEKHNCRFVITMGGVLSAQPAGEVYVAATSAKLTADIKENGEIIYSGGRNMGAAGIVLRLAQEQEFEQCLSVRRHNWIEARPKKLKRFRYN